ncbi:MAG: hypothetical protein AAFY09_00675 [Pseudomonadota bacterium]
MKWVAVLRRLWGSVVWGFEVFDKPNRPTVMVVGVANESCATAALSFASNGARVVAIDVDADVTAALAKQYPDHIEALEIDVLRSKHCRHLAKNWDAEPLDLLVHGQLLRYPDRPAVAVQSIERLTYALAPALSESRGQVIYLCEDHPEPRGIARNAFRSAYSTLAEALHQECVQVNVSANGVRLPSGGVDAVGRDEFEGLLTGLFLAPAARLGGSLLSVMPGSD